MLAMLEAELVNIDPSTGVLVAAVVAVAAAAAADCSGVAACLVLVAFDVLLLAPFFVCDFAFGFG